MKNEEEMKKIIAEILRPSTKFVKVNSTTCVVTCNHF